jgi:rare lipoprotein A
MDAKWLIRLCIYSAIALITTATIIPDPPAEASLPPTQAFAALPEPALDQPPPRQPPPRDELIGLASWYGPDHQGRRTASGARFDWRKLTAAHRTLPLNSQVKITNLANGRSVVVTVNDRGPFVRDRTIDLSKRAAERLGMTKDGLAQVRIEPVSAVPQLALE